MRVGQVAALCCTGAATFRSSNTRMVSRVHLGAAVRQAFAGRTRAGAAQKRKAGRACALLGLFLRFEIPICTTVCNRVWTWETGGDRWARSGPCLKGSRHGQGQPP